MSSRTTRHPRVSIGCPVYNGERYLPQALDSLLAQTFEDFELIISDNASSDRTEEICRSYAAMDRRIRYVRNERNIGVYRNFNKVFGLGTGEYFKFAASDDFCAPTLIERCVGVLDAEPEVVAAYARVRFVDPDGTWLALNDPGWHLVSDSSCERLKYVLVSGHWVNVTFGVIRSRELARTRLFPPYPSGDYRLLAELCLQGKFVEVPEYLFYRRIHPDASTQNRDADWRSLFFNGQTGIIELPFWRTCLSHFGTILRSHQLSAPEKNACLQIVLRRMVSGRRELLGEVQTASHYAYKAAFRLVRGTFASK